MYSLSYNQDRVKDMINFSGGRGDFFPLGALGTYMRWYFKYKCAGVWSEIGNLICSRHLFKSTAVTYKDLFTNTSGRQGK